MQTSNGFRSINSLRNEIARVKSFYIADTLEYHEGCINTIHWSERGEYLLSGSDDRCIIISDVYNYHDPKIVVKRQLKAKSNIFTSKFLPHSSNNIVVSGFKCGCLIKSDLNREIDSHIYSHRFSVYDILTFNQFSNTFGTISHDRTVQFFDDRIKDYNKTTCARMCFHVDSKTEAKSPVGSMLFNCPVTAGDVHPIKDYQCFALATADGFVKLYDHRYLYRNDSDQTPNPFAVVRPLGLLPQNKLWSRLDYGRFHITGVSFEPINYYKRWDVDENQQSFDYSHNELYPKNSRVSQICSINSSNILVNHMYSSLFLYDMNIYERDLDSNHESKFIDDEEIQTGANEQENSANGEGNEQEDPTNRNFQRIIIRDLAHNDPQESRKISMDFLKRDRIINELNSLPRYRQIGTFTGIRSQNTVIKNCCFWGNDFVMSGSECGHVIIWNRYTMEPVSSFRGDRCVVNRIAPHPIWPMLAISGIDNSIKIIESDPEKTNSCEFKESIMTEDSDSKSSCSRERITKKLCELNDQNNQTAYKKNGNYTRFGLSQFGRQFIIRLLRSNIINNPQRNMNSSAGNAAN